MEAASKFNHFTGCDFID